VGEMRRIEMRWEEEAEKGKSKRMAKMKDEGMVGRRIVRMIR
jgi:hypothetical protein